MNIKRIYIIALFFLCAFSSGQHTCKARLLDILTEWKNLKPEDNRMIEMGMTSTVVFRDGRSNSATTTFQKTTEYGIYHTKYVSVFIANDSSGGAVVNHISNRIKRFAKTSESNAFANYDAWLKLLRESNTTTCSEKGKNELVTVPVGSREVDKLEFELDNSTLVSSTVYYEKGQVRLKKDQYTTVEVRKDPFLKKSLKQVIQYSLTDQGFDFNTYRYEDQIE